MTHRNLSTFITSTATGQFEEYLDCRGDKELYWLFIQLAYLQLLSFLLVIMVVKTRKIKHNNFKDTKKVIALVTWVVMSSNIGLVMYFIFQTINADYLYTHVLIVVTDCAFILECLLFLYIPKLFAIFKARYL